MQRKLLAESQSTLARALEIMFTMEMAARNADNLRILSEREINRIHSKKNSTTTRRKSIPRMNTSEKCSRGGGAHSSNKCRFKNATLPQL